MKNFKEMLDKDLDSTFYNLSEFAQLKRVKCDGIDKKIPVILDSEETKAVSYTHLRAHETSV